MRRANRGVTITELLTVVALLTILTSFVTPFVVSVKHAALARACANNLRQCYVGLQDVANSNYGKLPTCVVPNTTDSPLKFVDYGLKEDFWWYRKLFTKLYRDKDITVGSPSPSAPTPDRKYVLPEYLALRCAGSVDPYDQARTPGNFNRVDSIDKDRVFDDCFGYNNSGFKYGGAREDQTAVPNPATLPWGGIGASYYYHTTGAWGAVTGRPRHMRHVQATAGSPPPCLCGAAWLSCVKANKCDCGNTWPCPYTRIGEFAEVPEAARTILMMDYVKADAAPNLKNDQLWAYRFRHGGSANITFVDGHVNSYTKPEFLKDWGEPDHTGGTGGFGKDKVTGRARIHWAVLRP